MPGSHLLFDILSTCLHAQQPPHCVLDELHVKASRSVVPETELLWYPEQASKLRSLPRSMPRVGAEVGHYFDNLTMMPEHGNIMVCRHPQTLPYMSKCSSAQASSRAKVGQSRLQSMILVLLTAGCSLHIETAVADLVLGTYRSAPRLICKA